MIIIASRDTSTGDSRSRLVVAWAREREAQYVSKLRGVPSTADKEIIRVILKLNIGGEIGARLEKTTYRRKPSPVFPVETLP